MAPSKNKNQHKKRKNQKGVQSKKWIWISTTDWYNCNISIYYKIW